MKLRNKLVIAQLCVFLVIMGILLMALPELVYRNISVKDREDTMILNEQIINIYGITEKKREELGRLISL